ncbi:MAG: ABC transporter ATP-binding protein [Microthrixaceae bacterium]
MSASLRVSNLHYSYPDGRSALHGVTLRVDDGERVAILGPNGAGKTTLMLHLNGILTPASGSVEVGGLPVTPANLREIRRRVGLVFQDPDDQLFMARVADDVAFGPANLGFSGEDLAVRTLNALEQVGMSAERDSAPHHLSFGQRRRVALATVLAMDPRLLVLDEPTSNLDPAARRELAELLVASQLSTLIVTHDLLYALELCPRSVVMCEGRVLADGPTAELLADDELMRASRLGLPVGVDPRLICPPLPTEDRP